MKYELKECTLIPYPYNGSVTAQVVDGKTIAYFKVKNSKVGNIYDQYFINKPHLPYYYMPKKNKSEQEIQELMDAITYQKPQP